MVLGRCSFVRRWVWLCFRRLVDQGHRVKTKVLRVTFNETRVLFEVICNGQKDLINDLYRAPDVEFITIAEQLAEKHKIDEIEYKDKR